MPRPMKRPHPRRAVTETYIKSCSSRDGARKALQFGLDRHRTEIADNLPLLMDLAAEFGAELPAFAWIHRRIKELS